MKFSTIIGFILFLNVAAQAQVLGESKGQGQMTYDLEMITGPTKKYEGTCKIAMNIRQTPADFMLEFSVFECPYLGSWNDPVLKVFAKRDQLLDAKGNVVGQVFADGTYKFTFSSTVVHKYSYVEVDANCNIWGAVHKKLNFNTKMTYTFRDLGNGLYAGTRVVDQEKMAWSTYKPYPRCSGTTIPVKKNSKSRIHFTVQK
jgi:hypothetical protein